MKQLIEEQRKDFDIWFKEYPGVPTIGEIQEWYEDRFKQFIDGLIEREESKKKDEWNIQDEFIESHAEYNEAKRESIAHLKKLKEELN